ncbi:MAG: DUF3267 domain-containing protein [Burkholderiales bacterium]
MKVAPEPLAGPIDPYDAAWRQVQDLHSGVAQAVALVVGATLCATTFVLWVRLVPFHPVRTGYGTLLIAAAIVIFMHELAHIVAFVAGRPRGADIEIVWRHRRPSLQYRGAVSRTRYLVVLAAPLVAVSFFPILASVALSLRSGDLVLVSMLNALVSGTDAVAAAVVLLQVPPGAFLQRRGPCVIWRPAAG